MNIIKLKFFSDPGHGWLQVDRSFAEQLYLKGYAFTSQFSYYDDKHWYLEEDCDAPRFENAVKEYFGATLDITHHSRNSPSPIRVKKRL